MNALTHRLTKAVLRIPAPDEHVGADGAGGRSPEPIRLLKDCPVGSRVEKTQREPVRKDRWRIVEQEMCRPQSCRS